MAAEKLELPAVGKSKPDVCDPPSRRAPLEVQCSRSAAVVEDGSPTPKDPKRRRFLPQGAAPDEFRTIRSLVDRFAHTPDAKSLIFVMVGLPARGKSFVSMRLARFLQWIGIETRVFNVGKYRRMTETGIQDANYFDPHSSTANSRREELAMHVCDEMLSWVCEGQGRFAVFDATNTTRARRSAVATRIGAREGVFVVFIESLCADADVLEINIQQKLSKSPDYSSMDVQAAREDLLERIRHYEKVYEPLDDEAIIVNGKRRMFSYIKLVNFASHVVAHNIYGRAATTVLPYLMALHIGSHPVWLVRMPHSAESVRDWRTAHKGEWPPPPHIRFSEHPLSPSGHEFADAIAKFVQRQTIDVAVFCCSYKRCTEVGDRLGGGRIRTSLNPQDRGACSGLSAAEIQAQYPEIWADPLTKRFVGGENLGDMLLRLMPTLIEIEQEMRPSLVVAPCSVLQVLYCYFAQHPVREAMSMDMPMHTVIEMRPDGGNFIEKRLAMSEL